MTDNAPQNPPLSRLGKLNWLWSFAALAVVLVGLLLTRTVIDPGDLDVAGLMGAENPQWYSFPLTVLVFILLAFVGMPQWVLIGAAVLVFGPVLGGAISWVATLVSALLNFALGRAMGRERLQRRLGERAKRWVDRVSEEGMMAALIVRLVPVAPFVLINMAAGASNMKARDFAIGTAIGIIPKIAAIAVFGRGLVELVRGDNLLLGVGLLVVAVVIGVFIWRIRRRHKVALGADTAGEVPLKPVKNSPDSEASP